MTRVVGVALFMAISMPLLAQADQPAISDPTPSESVSMTRRAAPLAEKRELKVVSNIAAANYLAKFNSSSPADVTSSVLYESGGFIGLGTTTPASALHIVIPDGASSAPLKVETTGVDSVAGISLKNDAKAWLIRNDGTDGDKFKIFDSAANGGSGASRLTIDENGLIGYRTTNPKAPLHIYSDVTGDAWIGTGFDPGSASAFNFGYSGSSFGRGSAFFNVRPDALAIAPNPSMRFLTGNVGRMIIANTGYVGIGINTMVAPSPIGTWAGPEQILHVWQDGDVQTTIEVRNRDAVGTTSTAALRTDAGLAKTTYVSHGAGRGTFSRYGIQLAGWSEILTYSGNGFAVGTNINAPVVLGTNNAERLRIQGDGNVGIGTSTPAAKLHVNGDIRATGAIYGATVIGAVYQDVAEWVPASTEMTAGTVVVLNKMKSNEVIASSKPYDSTVAGVVSAQPGILLGIAGDEKERIATTGRVKVRVDATREPIEVGDLLVTGDRPGTAMKSIPVEIGAISMHRPGTIIGKALEPLNGGVGDILVLLSLQ